MTWKGRALGTGEVGLRRETSAGADLLLEGFSTVRGPAPASQGWGLQVPQLPKGGKWALAVGTVDRNFSAKSRSGDSGR